MDENPFLGPSLEAARPDNVTGTLTFLLNRVLGSKDPAQLYAQDFIRAVAAASGPEAREAERKLKNVFGKDLNLNHLRSDIADARSEMRTALPGNPDAIDVSNTSLHAMTERACAALVRTNQRLMSMYLMGQVPINVLRNATSGDMQAVIMTEDRMRGEIDRAAKWQRFVHQSADYRPVPAPKDVAKDILSRPEDIGLPTLLAIVHRPFMRVDGTIVESAGYDPATQIYLDKSKTISTLGKLPHTQEAAVDAALWLSEELFSDFPFDSQASKANALALVLTACLRNIIPGSVPAAAISATAHGAGKSKIAEIVACIDTGRPAALTGLGKSEEEIEKQLTSIFLRNPAGLIVLDNISGHADSANLARSMTGSWDGRMLGASKQITLLTTCTHIWTGNNLSMSNELARRSYLIRLEPPTSDPYYRANLRHPQILTWIGANRTEIISKVFIIARAWFAAGKPSFAALRRLGSFEDFTEIIGGMLYHAGVTAFMGNQDSHMKVTDGESGEWESFIEELVAWRGFGAWTASELVREINATSVSGIALREAMPAAIAGCMERKTPEISVGKVLKFRKDRRYGAENSRITTELNVSPVRWLVRKGTN